MLAQAAPTIFFGENQTPGGLVVGAPLTAHDAFLAAITGAGVEDFESFALLGLAGLGFSRRKQ